MTERKKLTISKSLYNEIQQDASQLKNFQQAEKLFDNFDSRMNEVSRLIEKLPDNAIVRPKSSWLNIFGIEK